MAQRDLLNFNWFLDLPLLTLSLFVKDDFTDFLFGCILTKFFLDCKLINNIIAEKKLNTIKIKYKSIIFTA